MSEDRNDHDELLQLLASLEALIDPIPADAVVAAIACFEVRSIDAELAELLFDSERAEDQLVGVRSRTESGSRQLTFGATDLVLEVEIDPQSQPQLIGQLVPPGPAEVEIRSPGASIVVDADRLGRFSADTLPGGLLSLRVVPGDDSSRPADTPWLSILPAPRAPTAQRARRGQDRA